MILYGMSFSKMKLSVMTLSITALSITTFRIMSLSLIEEYMTPSINYTFLNDTQHKV